MSDIDVFDVIYVFLLRLYITKDFVFQKCAVMKHEHKNSF